MVTEANLMLNALLKANKSANNWLVRGSKVVRR